MPRLERRAAHVPGAAELVADYEAWLAVGGRGSPSYRNAAWSFLARWPDPAGFAAEPLEVQQSLGVAQRPFVTYLMATGRLRPGYDYLSRKIGGLLAHAGRGPFAADVTAFTAAATDLDYSGHTVRCVTERVIVRLLIQTGRPLNELTTHDLDELAAAFGRRTETRGKPAAWAADRAMISTAHRVLFHLGILDAPPADPRRRPGLSGYCNGVAEPLRTVFGDYCTQAAATRAAATVKATAGHLADFGRFLSARDPPVTDLALLDRPTVEAWLAALAAARLRSGNPMSIGYRRGRIITVRQFLTDITEWGWPAAPGRILIFSRDLPRLQHPLPRYLPPDADRALLAVLTDLSGSAPAGLTRLHADALLLTRATGIRIGELRDLELDCVHQIDGHGAWLKVPLGKLATERMVPLDDETVTILDRIAARRTPGRSLPHPRTGAPVDFLLVHQGRRISACALREELARACHIAEIPTATPHYLRHTFATALDLRGIASDASFGSRRYGWAAECEARFGTHPVQICHEWNTAVHVADYEGRPGRRPFTRTELQAFFDYADDRVGAARAAGRKGWLAAFRDATLFKVTYAWGLRRRESAMLDVADFTTNPAVPQLGQFGTLAVRYGKAMRGSPPRRRQVATVMPWAAEVVEEYVTDVRPCYAASDQPALFLTERGERISLRQVDERFAVYRAGAGLPHNLTPHCLRHSYISHLIEEGVDPTFVQRQAGHSWASTTAGYTTVGADHANRMLRAAVERAFVAAPQGNSR